MDIHGWGTFDLKSFSQALVHTWYRVQQYCSEYWFIVLDSHVGV